MGYYIGRCLGLLVEVPCVVPWTLCSIVVLAERQVILLRDDVDYFTTLRCERDLRDNDGEMWGGNSVTCQTY